MKATTVGLLALGGIVVYKVYGLAALSNAGDRLKVDPMSVSVLGVQKLAIQFRLNMKGANPTGTDLRVDGVQLDVALPGGGQVARIRAGLAELDGGLKLPGNAVTEFGIPFEVSLISLVLTAGSTAVTALTTGQLPKEVTIKGEIKVNGIAVAYDEHIPLKRGANA